MMTKIFHHLTILGMLKNLPFFLAVVSTKKKHFYHKDS